MGAKTAHICIAEQQLTIHQKKFVILILVYQGFQSMDNQSELASDSECVAPSTTLESVYWGVVTLQTVRLIAFHGRIEQLGIV